MVYEPHKSHGKFTRDEYVEADFLGERCILYIHDILVPKDQLSSVPQLLATKYSPLSSCLPLYCTADTGQDRELLVHFTDYSRMGQRGDAEKIGIDEISARRTTTVDHVIDIRGESVINQKRRIISNFQQRLLQTTIVGMLSEESATVAQLSSHYLDVRLRPFLLLRLHQRLRCLISPPVIQKFLSPLQARDIESMVPLVIVRTFITYGR